MARTTIEGIPQTLQRTFRVAEDRTFADVEDSRMALSDEAIVGIVHPLEIDRIAPERG